MPMLAWQAVVQDQGGNAVVNPSITVRNFSDNSLASIFADSDGTIPIANPFIGESSGFVKFYADYGRYLVEGAYGASTTASWDVLIEDYTGRAEAAADAADAAAETAAASSSEAMNFATDAEAARDAAVAGAILTWPTTAAGLGNGIAGVTAIVGGSGGANGTFALAFSGGTQVISPVGVFTVSGGAVVSVVITYPGYYSAGTPSLSFAASAGLTGASATVQMAANTPVNGFFAVPSTVLGEAALIYKNVAGTAVLQFTTPSTAFSPTYQTTDAVVDTDQDAKGRWWLQRRADGTTRIQKLADAVGNRLDTAIVSNTSRINSLEAAALLQPPVQRLRMKRALYNSGQLPRAVSPVDPLTYAGTTTTSATLPVIISKSDARIRFLGGNIYDGAGGYPNTFFRYCFSRTNGETATISPSTGLPANRDSISQFIEFVLPAGQTEFEMLLRGQGTSGNVFVDIDGVGTNAAGYAWSSSGDSFQWRKFTLPSSLSARVIRISMTNRPFGGLAVQAGGTIGPAPIPSVGLSGIAIGDSITAGSIASTVMTPWVALVMRALGVDNAINSGIGGSGYIARFPFQAVTVSTTSGSASVSVTSGTLTEGAFISGPGIPRDATVLVGAIAGGTATISAAATATATGVTVRNETGRNFRDRITDVTQAISAANPPDFVIVSGGLNDRGIASEGFFSLPDFSAQVLAYFQALRAAAPDMVIIALGPMGTSATPGYSATLTATAAAIRAAAAQVARVHFIDVAPIWTSGFIATGYNTGVDVTHPIDQGHADIAAYLIPRIAEIVEGY